MVSVKDIPGASGLNKEQLLAMYRKMALARAVGERERMLNRLGKTPFAVTGEGQEAAQVGVAFAMRPGQDWIVPYYRDIGVALTIGQTPRDLLLANLFRAEDISGGGRNMPAHFSDPKLRIVSASACVGTQIPHAVGIALASKLRKLDEVTATFFGDGATSTGDWHESMNFAGIHKLPVIFVCENNGYAISVPWRKQSGVESLASRAEAYGFPGVSVDGNDVLAVYKVAIEAMSRARSGEGPTLIEARTYRIVPHTSDDDDRRYRSREEVEEWKKKDPLARFAAWIEEHGVADRSDLERMQEKIAQEVDEATDYAEQAPVAEPESALRHVYVDAEKAV